jgi:hypothetical protein
MAGYYQTPNLMIPHNKRNPGEIADIALADLAGWQAVASEWDVYTDGRVNRCKECHQSIWFTKDPQGHDYQYTDDEILTLKVAHLRQCHAEIGT